MKPWKWCTAFLSSSLDLFWTDYHGYQLGHPFDRNNDFTYMCGKFRITRVLVIAHTHCKTNLFWDACLSTEYYLLHEFNQLTIAHRLVCQKATQMSVLHEHNNYNINLSTLVYVYLKMALFQVFSVVWLSRVVRNKLTRMVRLFACKVCSKLLLHVMYFESEGSCALL